MVSWRLEHRAQPTTEAIEFLAELPKTPSGKVQRFVLRQRA
jgi:acyl-coenzyme A synthetase/AMP-(fatty) acid ligase